MYIFVLYMYELLCELKSVLYTVMRQDNMLQIRLFKRATL